MFESDEMSEIFSGTRPITSSIREVEELARQPDAFLYLTLPPGIQAQLFQWGIEAEARSQFSRTTLTGSNKNFRLGPRARPDWHTWRRRELLDSGEGPCPPAHGDDQLLR